jgi:hypothetical protein
MSVGPYEAEPPPAFHDDRHQRKRSRRRFVEPPHGNPAAEPLFRGDFAAHLDEGGALAKIEPTDLLGRVLGQRVKTSRFWLSGCENAL